MVRCFGKALIDTFSELGICRVGDSSELALLIRATLSLRKLFFKCTVQLSEIEF